MDIYSRNTFTDSRKLLDELFEAVKVEETVLPGGDKLGLGGQVIDDLRRTKINFGNPQQLHTIDAEII